MDAKSLLAAACALTVLGAGAQPARPPAEPLWYLVSSSRPPEAAWFAVGAEGLELRVLEQGRPRASRISFTGHGFVEEAPDGPAVEWQLDGLGWRSDRGTQLIPAWVVPPGRGGPGH